MDESGDVQYIHFMERVSTPVKNGQETFGASLTIDCSEMPVHGAKYRFQVTKSLAGLLRANSVKLLENPVSTGDKVLRRKQIDHLIRHVEFERDELYGRGFVDGTGMLYQMTSTYQRLLECCTDCELREIHDKIIPAAQYVPSSRRDKVSVEPRPSLLDSEVDSIFSQTTVTFKSLYIEGIGEGLIPYADLDHLFD